MQDLLDRVVVISTEETHENLARFITIAAKTRTIKKLEIPVLNIGLHAYPSWFEPNASVADRNREWQRRDRHLQVISKALLDGVEHLLVFEADAAITPEFDVDVANFIQDLPAGWLGYQLGGDVGKGMTPVTSNCGRMLGSVGVFAYGLSKAGIKRTYDHVLWHTGMALDPVMQKLHGEESDYYAPRNWIVRKDDDKSPCDNWGSDTIKKQIYCFWGYSRQAAIGCLKKYFEGNGYAWKDRGNWSGWYELNDVITDIRNSEHVFVWHGREAMSIVVRQICQEYGKPFTFVEFGWLPQLRSFHLDPKGIVGCSSLCDELDWVTPEMIQSFNSTHPKTWKGKNDSYVLVPLQVEHDVSVYMDAPRGLKTMNDLVQHVVSSYSDKEIVVSRHPNTSKPKINPGRWRFNEVSTSEAIPDAGIVVGLTSTVLLESAAAGCPTVAIGNCPLRQHKDNIERLLAAYWTRQIPNSATDLSKWFNQLSLNAYSHS